MFGERVGAAEGVDQGADGVGDSAGDDEQRCREADVRLDLRERRSTATQPRAIAIVTASHFGLPIQQTLSTIAAAAPPHDDAEHDDLPVPVQDEQPERRVAAGDQRVDADVIDPAHPLPPRRRASSTRW